MASNLSKCDSDESLESIGLGPSMDLSAIDVSQLPKLKEFTNSKLEPEGGSPIDEYIYNCIVYIFYCPRHQRIVLTLNERSKAVWLPFVVLQPDKTWTNATTEGVAIVFSKEDSEIDPRLVKTIPIQSISCVHILRIQLPITKKFIYRLIQLITLGSDTETFKCCQSSKHLQWIDMNDAVSGNITGLWGPEIPMFVSFIMDQKPKELSEYGFDHEAFINILGFHEIVCQKDTKEKNPEEIMLSALQINKKDIEKVYSDFLEHCFPSFYMTYWSFCSYINDYIHEYETSLQLFQAFNATKSGFITFQEFFSGIASIEPGCPTTVVRLKFIFRYYDVNRDGLLNKEELKKLFNDLNLSPFDYETLLHSFNVPISFTAFYEMVEGGVIKTESLCRASSPLLVHICLNFQKRNDTRISVHKQNKSEVKQTNVDKSKGPCLDCRERNYEFGSYCVRFDKNGRCIEARNIIEHDDLDEDSENEMSMYKYSRDYVYSTVSIGHTFLDMIREFNAQNKREKIGFFTGTESHELFIRYVSILCQNVSSLLECEDKLMKINSAAFVIGDILGDLNNLINLERALWQSVPVVPNNYVFLGNYVNIGSMGIECILYLFALKIIAPNKFFLLRGNNEIRSMQKNKFHAECLKKYGSKIGMTVFEMVNELFDKMALAIIIDESILCVNSGVPDPSTKLEDIYNLPKDLKNPLENSIAKSILTNTRCSNEQISHYLEYNDLSYVIRANQFIEKGFYFGADGKCIQIFSMPTIFGKNNALTVACVDHPKIRIIKIDTQIEKKNSKE